MWGGGGTSLGVGLCVCVWGGVTCGKGEGWGKWQVRKGVEVVQRTYGGGTRGCGGTKGEGFEWGWWRVVRQGGIVCWVGYMGGRLRCTCGEGGT